MSRDITSIDVWSTNQTINGTAAITSDAIVQHWSSGTCSLLIILSGTTPSVNITITVGRSPTDVFYSPVDIDNNSLSTIGTAATATRWIQFSPVIAPAIKVVVTGDGSNGVDTTVRAYLMFQEEF